MTMTSTTNQSHSTTGSSSTSYAKVPAKFYQVCRLCLTVVNDADAVRLSIFKTRHRHNVQQPPQHTPVIIRNNNNAVVQHKNDGGTSTTSSTTYGGGGIMDYTVGHVEAANGMSSEEDDLEDDDESRLEILHRIYTFLDIEVSENINLDLKKQLSVFIIFFA